MTVIVFAQDLSARKDDGYYKKPNITTALEIFFEPAGDDNFLDANAEHPLSRSEAEEIFEQDRRVTFYNADGEKIIISLDPNG